MRTLNIIVFLLVIIGALNWGLFGLVQYDVIASLFGGSASNASRVAYVIIGLAGLYSIGFFRHMCKCGCRKPGCK